MIDSYIYGIYIDVKSCHVIYILYLKCIFYILLKYIKLYHIHIYTGNTALHFCYAYAKESLGQYLISKVSYTCISIYIICFISICIVYYFVS